MSNEESLREEFSVYKGSVARMRWFLITAILISVLIILHVYLEQFGFQRKQFDTLYVTRIQNYSKPYIKCLEDLAVYEQHKMDRFITDPADPKVILVKDPRARGGACSPDKLPQRILDKISALKDDSALQVYSATEVLRQTTDHTLGELKLEIRKIPLLGVEVPANDFVNVMAIMSLVFVVGTWLNLRSVLASLRALTKHKDKEILRLAQLNTIFPTSIKIGGKNYLGNFVRGAALWLPFFAIFFGTVIGYQSTVGEILHPAGRHFGTVGLVLTHLGIATAIILLHLWIASESRYTIRDIDELFEQDTTGWG